MPVSLSLSRGRDGGVSGTTDHINGSGLTGSARYC